jgi:elongation factor Ts
MSKIKIEQIKQLRDETGVSVSEVKKALEESKGDAEKAKEFLRAWGKTLLDKKTSRETKSGLIDTYLHPNAKTGVLLDIRCESDFVAKSPEFKKLAHEICLQIAAMDPLDGASLLSQPWIRDATKTIQNLIEDAVAKVGENIEVKKFSRFEI